MRITNMNRYILLLCLLAPPLSAWCQLSTGLPPASFNSAYKSILESPQPDIIQVSAPDLNIVREEDRTKYNDIRFAVPVKAAISLEKDGQWIYLPNGDRLCRFLIRIPGALGIGIGYEQFQLPPGATLHHYSPDKKQVFGAYTQANQQTSGRFMTGISTGDMAIVEYYEPLSVIGKGNFQISNVYFVYKNEGLSITEPVEANSTGFGASFPCQINVNCPQGTDWQDEKRGIVRIRMAFQEGLGYCSGSMINNTSNDGTPYLLTANHCQAGFTPFYDMWTFYFNYESANCNNPASEPALNSLMGCTLRAARQATDVMLIELNDNPSPSLNVFFNGWDRTLTPASGTTTMIHHPLGDIKKITIDNSPLTIYNNTINWGGGDISPAASHLLGVPDLGTFQQGSSGAAAFNQSGKIIGQLHGGTWNSQDSCQATTLYFGRFAISWDQGSTIDTRLREWLDPGNTDVTSLNGIENPVIPTATMSGQVMTWWNVPMPNLRVVMSGAQNDTVWTDTNGNYSFAEVQLGGSVSIYPYRDSAIANGVTAFDLVNIRKHILIIESLPTPYQIISADANGSNSVTALDLVQIRKVVLLIDSAFPGVPSWRFVPSLYSFPIPGNPFSNLPIPNAYSVQLTGNSSGLNFTGCKTGDVNGSANPGF